MLIGPLVRLPKDLWLAILYFCAILPSCGRLRSNLSFHGLRPKLSIDPWSLLAVSLRQLLSNLCVPHLSHAQLYCDSQAAMHIIANFVYHERTTHIEVDCHFIRDEY